ncbi:hypothetical protein [uncultured Clostridium sp.]|uniref:hypothetical protein n=1 Tax=uncultured Clostridium sp. TaxID=59620 RepID=UPI00262CFD23|nr:hypothetical protein [uncultured Clostridium sp.]
MEKKNRPKSVTMAYLFGGLSVAGALLTFISGFFFGILGIIASLVAMKKHGESVKVMFSSLIGLSLSVIVLILFLVLGPIEQLIK